MSLNLSKKTINRACLFFLIVFTLLIISTGCDNSGSSSPEHYITFDGETYAVSYLFTNIEENNKFDFQLFSDSLGIDFEGESISGVSGSGVLLTILIDMGMDATPDGIYGPDDHPEYGLYIITDGILPESPHVVSSGEISVSVSEDIYTISGTVTAEEKGTVTFSFKGVSSGSI